MQSSSRACCIFSHPLDMSNLYLASLSRPFYLAVVRFPVRNGRTVSLNLGTKLPVGSTGYQNMRDVNAELFGAEVIDQTRPVWGMDDEGEVSGSYRPSGCPGVRRGNLC